MKNAYEGITIRKLRKILTDVEDQEMTIRKLREILFEIEDQDAELKDTDMIRLTSDLSTCYHYEFDDESYVRNFPATMNKDGFFSKVSEEIAMSDCSDVRVTKIVYKGVSYEYEGWKPGMHYVFDGEDGDTWEGWFPNLDH